MRWLTLALLAALVAACDRDRVERLEEGVSTEADVRQQFGEPEAVWNEANGSRTFEYNRQPEGRRNYMITIGPNGRMTALRQVLNADNFRRVVPGMGTGDVRQLLGRPAKVTPYTLANETAWDWRYTQPPNTAMVFAVWFDPAGRVKRTTTAPDPQAPEI